MTPNQHRRRALLVATITVAALAGCGSEGLSPEVPEDTVDGPPATDTRTTDAPTASNLPITQP
jgi:predicted small lipoprotein YifL